MTRLLPTASSLCRLLLVTRSNVYGALGLDVSSDCHRVCSTTGVESHLCRSCDQRSRSHLGNAVSGLCDIFLEAARPCRLQSSALLCVGSVHRIRSLYSTDRHLLSSRGVYLDHGANDFPFERTISAFQNNGLDCRHFVVSGVVAASLYIPIIISSNDESEQWLLRNLINSRTFTRNYGTGPGTGDVLSMGTTDDSQFDNCLGTCKLYGCRTSAICRQENFIEQRRKLFALICISRGGCGFYSCRSPRCDSSSEKPHRLLPVLATAAAVGLDSWSFLWRNRTSAFIIVNTVYCMRSRCTT